MTERANVFGWRDAAPSHAHAYLMPTLLEVVRECAGAGRKLSIVDLGCGNGYVPAVLHGLGHGVVALDSAVDGLEIARRSFPGIRFVEGWIGDHGLDDQQGRVDLVVSLEVVEHLYDPSALFNQAAMMLLPGGTLVVSTPYHGYLKNMALSVLDAWDAHLEPGRVGGHIKQFSMTTLRALAVNSGFVPVRLVGVGRVPWLWKSMILVARKPA